MTAGEAVTVSHGEAVTAGPPGAAEWPPPRKGVLFTAQIPAPAPGEIVDHVVEIRGDRVGLLLTRAAARALVRSLAGFLEGTR